MSELRAGRVPSEGMLCRPEIEKSAKEMLHRGGWGNPDVLLVQTKAGPVVVKDFSPRSGWVRRWLGPWSLRREERAYRHLEGLAAVPLLLGRVDELAIILEYRPGVLLSRSLRGTLPVEFLPELETGVEDMHARGLVHLDLRHRSNVLAGDQVNGKAPGGLFRSPRLLRATCRPAAARARALLGPCAGSRTG